MSLAEDIRQELTSRRPSRERARRAVAELTDDRRIEWLTAAVFMGLGVTLSFPGNTLETARVFAELYELLGPRGEFFMGWLMMTIAIAKGAALTVNGVRGRPTSNVRFITSAIGAGVFAALAYIIALPWLLGDIPAPSTGIFTYAALAGADYTSAMRAARDARIYRDG